MRALIKTPVEGDVRVVRVLVIHRQLPFLTVFLKNAEPCREELRVLEACDMVQMYSRVYINGWKPKGWLVLPEHMFDHSCHRCGWNRSHSQEGDRSVKSIRWNGNLNEAYDVYHCPICDTVYDVFLGPVADGEYPGVEEDGLWHTQYNPHESGPSALDLQLPENAEGDDVVTTGFAPTISIAEDPRDFDGY